MECCLAACFPKRHTFRSSTMLFSTKSPLWSSNIESIPNLFEVNAFNDKAGTLHNERKCHFLENVLETNNIRQFLAAIFSGHELLTPLLEDREQKHECKERGKNPSIIFRLDQPKKSRKVSADTFYCYGFFLCNRQLAVVLSNAEVLHLHTT